VGRWDWKWEVGMRKSEMKEGGKVGLEVRSWEGKTEVGSWSAEGESQIGRIPSIPKSLNS